MISDQDLHTLREHNTTVETRVEVGLGVGLLLVVGVGDQRCRDARKSCTSTSKQQCTV